METTTAHGSRPGWVWYGILVLAASCDPGGLPDGGAAALFVNELMASNSLAIADDSGEYDDWIELYNGTDHAVELEGYYISDDPNDHYRKRLPAGLTIEPDGVLLLWADGQPEQGDTHLPFKLQAAAEAVYVSAPDGTLLDSVEYTMAPTDQAYARLPDGDGPFEWCAAGTPGSKNGTACP